MTETEIKRGAIKKERGRSFLIVLGELGHVFVEKTMKMRILHEMGTFFFKCMLTLRLHSLFLKYVNTASM